MSFKRARSKKQKDIRIGQIAEAAAKLYGKTDYNEITLAAIAGELSFTRANLYKYIKTKEEIFLVIILSDLDAWIGELQKEFIKNEKISIEEFAEIWSKTLNEHKRLIELMSILYTVIEKKVTVEKLADFKTGMISSLDNLFTLIKSVMPSLSNAAVGEFVYMQLYYVMGMYPATKQSEVQKKAVALSGIPYTAPNFTQEFQKFILFSLNGLINK